MPSDERRCRLFCTGWSFGENFVFFRGWRHSRSLVAQWPRRTLWSWVFCPDPCRFWRRTDWYLIHLQTHRCQRVHVWDRWLRWIQRHQCRISWMHHTCWSHCALQRYSFWVRPTYLDRVSLWAFLSVRFLSPLSQVSRILLNAWGLLLDLWSLRTVLMPLCFHLRLYFLWVENCF